MSSSSPLDALWAKSAQGGAASGETLIDHTRAVVGQLPVLRRRLAGVPESLGAPAFWRWAELSLRCHDLGKAAAGFQRQVRTGQRWGRRHEVASLAFVGKMVTDDRDLGWVSAAIVTHHLDFGAIYDRYDPDIAMGELESLVGEIAAADAELVLAWLGLPRGTLDPGDVARCLKAARALVDSLRSEPAGRLLANLLRGVVLTADHSGSAHARLREKSSVVERAALPPNPYSHQVEAAVAGGNMILRAPTGAGKTEAALVWAHARAEQAAAEGRAPRLFYVLPYQASIGAMHRRLVAVATLSGRRAAPDSDEVAVVHSRAAQQVYRWLLDEEATPQSAAARAKRQRALARLSVPAARVTTPYQLLKGLFGGRGSEPALADTASSLFVLDELHAYEPQRLGMILAALRLWTRELGGRAAVLSATLPTRLVAQLDQVLESPSHVTADAATFEQFRRHRLCLVDGALDAAAAAPACQKAVADGGAVLLVVNQVGRAIELGGALRKVLPGVPVEVLHSRFTAGDRLAKEARLIECRGPAGGEPLVCVSTQVVEVSLDVDFDLGLFEAAPLDALIQRMGRVNRRRRRPLADVVIYGGARDDPAPYDAAQLEAAWWVLSAHRGEPVDEASLQGWLDQALERVGGERWSAAVASADASFQRGFVQAMPLFDTIDLADTFDRLFDGVEVVAEAHRDRYREAEAEQGALAAAEWLIPISTRRFGALRGQRLARFDASIRQWVVTAPYGPGLGLRL